MTKLLIIGSATQDIFMQQDSQRALASYQDPDGRRFLLFEEGSKIEIAKIDFTLGGGATNVAVSCKRQGLEPFPFFKIGNDCPGTFVLDRLAREKIRTELHTRSMHYATALSYIIPTSSGDRTILAYRGANGDLQQEDLPEFTNYNYLYIGSLAGKSARLLPAMVQSARGGAKLIMTNPGFGQLTTNINSLVESLAYIDIITLNTHEARTLFCWFLREKQELFKKTESSPKNNTQKIPRLIHEFYKKDQKSYQLKTYIDAVQTFGPKTVIVTDGAYGVYVAHQEKLYFHPSIREKVISTVGAGDAFGSTFFASTIQGYTIEESMLRGIINSAQVITHKDAQVGLLTKESLDDRMRTMTTKDLIDCT